MCSYLLNLNVGDQVIVPSFTFVSSANAFASHGAVPTFVDIREDTLNIDEAQIERKISDKTRAIVVVHYAGVGCAMNKISEIANTHGIPIVEDNAHGLFGKYRGKHLGTFGCLAAQSFHETKNFSCGEGGALFINDPTLAERAEILWEKGTNRSRFFRGQADKYTWVDYGSSFLPSDILAAVLLAQLEHREQIQMRRKHLWESYAENLGEWSANCGVRLPVVPPECEQAYHAFYMIMPSLDERTRFIAHMKARQIICVFHYLPLHHSEMGQKYGGKQGDCPVTERISERLVRLPFFTGMTDQEQRAVISAIQEFK
jgi:dTDP-4-amino-4,6-dideoxygalactose transaminase